MSDLETLEPIRTALVSLEEMRDEHQRQLLTLGDLLGQLQGTVATLSNIAEAQQRTITMLIDGYIEDHAHELGGPNLTVLALRDELAARRNK